MKFENYASKIGFSKEEGIFIRKEKDFLIYLKNWQYLVINIPSFFIPVNKTITKEEIKKLEQASLDNACGTATLVNKDDVLIVTLPEGKNKDNFVSNCENILQRVCKLLSIDGYQPLNICPICHKEGEHHAFKDDYIPIHEECKNKMIETLQKKVEEQKGFKINYVFSIALSIVFGICGLLPAFLLVYFKYFYLSPLVVLCPLLAVVGLYLSKAPIMKWLKVVTIIIPIVLIVSFDIWSLPYIANQNELEMIPYIFGHGLEGLRKIIVSMVLSFGTIGLLKFVTKLRPNYQEELKKIKK